MLDFKMRDKSLIRLNESTTELLSFLFITIAFLMLIQYHWGRRNLYRLASKISGPFCLPIVGCAYIFIGPSKNILSVITNLCNRCKFPVKLWFGNRLFFGIADPKHLQIILNDQNSLDKNKLIEFLKPIFGDGLFLGRGEQWKINRKIISQAFNQRILNEFVGTFSHQATIYAKNLEKRVGKEFDAHASIGKCVLNTVCETTMGVTLKSETEHGEILHILDDSLNILVQRIFKLWYQFDFIFYNSPLGRKLKSKIGKYVDFIDKVVMEKRALYVKNKELRQLDAQTEEGLIKKQCLLELLIEMTENEHFTDVQLRDEVSTFIVAGVDTTTTALGNIFMMMGMFPQFQQKIYEEVVEVVGAYRSVEHTDLPELRYTERFILETLRLFPLGSVMVRYHLADIDLGDVVLPAGSTSFLPVIYLHRCEKYWPDPLKFDPDRFLPEEVAKRHPYAFLGFSGGPRNCIGKKYGLMLMKCIVAHIARKFRISTPYEHIEDVKLEQNLLAKAVDGAKIKMVLRE